MIFSDGDSVTCYSIRHLWKTGLISLGGDGRPLLLNSLGDGESIF